MREGIELSFSRRSVLLTVVLVLAVVLFLDLNEPDSLVDRVEEKDRTTNLMAGSDFEVHFESGGNDRYNYVTHRENYCEVHPDASGCPPEDFPEKPPLIQKFNFTHPPNSTVYIPKEAVCMDETYQSCSGKSLIETHLENILYPVLGQEAFSLL